MTIEKIPTAEELAIKMFIKHPGSYSSFNRVAFTGKQLKEVAVAFAVLHTRAVLKSVLNTNIEEYDEGGYLGIDENAVLNAYPIENIKL